jgi:hypothetical protein
MKTGKAFKCPFKCRKTGGRLSEEKHSNSIPSIEVEIPI